MKKNEHHIRTQFGITQHDAAMLFGVTRTQWSMFELGKRDLPLHATLFINDMLKYLQASAKVINPPSTKHQKAMQQQITAMMRENEYQRIEAARQIADTSRKHETQIGLQRLADFLKTEHSGKEPIPGLYDAIAGRRSEKIEAKHSKLLFEQQHRFEMLEFEQKLLESKLEQLQSGTK